MALLYYAERPKTKRQDTSRKPLKSLPVEKPVIKMKTKGRGKAEMTLALTRTMRKKKRRGRSVEKKSAREEKRGIQKERKGRNL